MQYQINQIGVIHSPYATKTSCPIQGVAAPMGEGFVELFPEYAEGLKDIEGFSHIILLYRFDKAGEVKLVRPTFLDDTAHGVFASRHPCRPNGIGISIVKLNSRKDNILNVSRIDVLDGTPLIDIKPYVPKFDNIESATGGWTEDKALRPKPEGRE